MPLASNGAAALRALATLAADDVVVLLPLMYVGNSDVKFTPIGDLPGGFLVASSINSVLTGEWLKPVAGGDALVILLALLGVVLGVNFGVAAFWVTLVGGVATGVLASLALFAYVGVIVPWLFPLAAFIGAGVTVFAEKTRIGEKKVLALRQALEGAVAPDDLRQLLKRPERINFEARERVVTLMFIDVVGFSLLAENMLPRMAFDNLKKMLATLGEAVHRHGGIIDKTLGDGLLCYFGYRFDVDTSAPDHAEEALRCAIAIQRDNLQRNLDAAAAGEAVYPLRIGINTASCYLGDLGSGQRIDFTVVGNGVNFAKRLEGACDMHAVLMGATTYDLVKSVNLTAAAITRRFIRIKHHSELVDAYEFDPFHDEPDVRHAAIEAFRKCANIERIDQRWPVRDPDRIKLRCDFGVGLLVNFSHTGLSIKLPKLLAKGTRLNVTLDAASGALAALLEREGFGVLQGEVRWGYAEGAQFVHGVMLTNVSEARSAALVQYLCEFAFPRDGQDARGRGKGAA
jgi:class 3 adenylate cyclase